VWAVAGLAVVALLVVVVVARTGPHHAAASSAARNSASSWPAHAEGGACGILAPGGTVRLWNPATGRAVGAPLHASAPHGLYGVAFSPDGKLLATADGDGTVRLWNAATGPPAGGVVPSPVCPPGPNSARVP
jgi:WD40 repeat protein